MGRRPVRIARITVEHQRTGLQLFLKFLCAECHALIVVVGTFNFKIYSVAHKLRIGCEVLPDDLSAAVASAFFSRRGRRVLFFAGILPTPFLIRVVTEGARAATFPTAPSIATAVSFGGDFSGFFIPCGEQSDGQSGCDLVGWGDIGAVDKSMRR